MRAARERVQALGIEHRCARQIMFETVLRELSKTRRRRRRCSMCVNVVLWWLRLVRVRMWMWMLSLFLLFTKRAK